MLTPRTPQEVDPALTTFLLREGFGLWPFFQKDWQGCAQKPVVISFFYGKSLILEATPSTGWGRLSTGCASIYTASPVFYTDAVSRSSLYLSLLIIDKEEESRETGKEKQQSPIHGFLQLLKKASTGFHRSSTCFRGFRGLCSYCLSTIYAQITTHPRIHGWKCVWVF
ncbi:MAG: hypothetical protein LLG15_01725 [Betaproteobacteria bacterium]|nr:hypothetical protein [Betaproteobacteria bacterium]